MQSFVRQVARNSAFGMLAQLAIKLLSFGFSVLIVRQLGEAAFGQYTTVLAFVAIFAFISDLGLGSYTVRETARLRDQPDGPAQLSALFSNVLWLRLALAGLAIILVTVTAFLTGRPTPLVVAIALASCGLVLYAIQGSSEAILMGYERLDITSGARVLNQLLFVGTGSVVLLAGTGYLGLVLANLIGVSVMAYACWRGVRQIGLGLGAVQMPNWPRLLRVSLPFGVIGFTLGLSYKYDTILLNIFRGDAETGFYNAAYNLVFSLVLLSNVLNTALYPSLTRQAASNPQDLGQIYQRALRYLFILAIPVAVGGSLLAPQIVPFLFGERYLPAAPVLRLIIWAVPLMFLSEFLGYVVLIRGNERSAARSVLASTGINVICNSILVPMYGLWAAAIMTVITESVLVCQYIWILRKDITLSMWLNALLRPFLSAALMGALIWPLQQLPLLVLVALGAAVYALMLIVSRAVGNEELRFLRTLRRREQVGTLP